MKITSEVRNILNQYEGETPAVKLNLARIMMHGTLAGTGKLMILAVDQGFEHGPRAFVMNPDALDPHYHYQFAVDAGMNAYAAPLGSLEAGCETFLGAVPTILKLNSSNSLLPKSHYPDQAITASIHDALRLGCSAIGFTIYPGSDMSLEQIEEIKELSAEAKSCGLAVIMWAYARGADISKSGETALDVIAYGAHMACLLGAHIVKVKIPTDHLEIPAAASLYKEHVSLTSPEDRIRHIVKSCLNGRRMVIFSGGEAKESQDVLNDAQAVQAGGGNGVIIGRNCFQRPKNEGLALIKDIALTLQT